jgi:hypothetical protein
MPSKLDKVVYQANAKSTDGSDGATRASDARLGTGHAIPKVIRSSRTCLNPEPLSAWGYRASIVGTMRFVAGNLLSQVQVGAAAIALSLGLVVVSQVADAATELVKVDDSSFRCIRQMSPVRHFYVDNLLGNLEGTVAAANAPNGAIYPAGSVVQLVPTEAMVKREAGFSPATGDWEFFELQIDAKGSKIGKRGFVEVNNRFGKNCFACHVPAREPWDFVCESDHGCEPIPIDHKMTGALQRSDLRCGPEALESGDSMALWKLRVMVTIGATIDWFKSLL